MKLHELEYGWRISFPKDWVREADNGVAVFYPPNDPTTAYASVVHAVSRESGKPAPPSVLEESFLRTVPEGTEEILLCADGLFCRAFYSVDGNGIHRICAGMFTDGELLSLNVYSETREKAFDVLEYFKTVNNSVILKG